MKPSLQIRQTQSLTLTPQLRQAIRLLQLSSVELEAEISEALESNPLLEALDDNGADGDDAPVESATEAPAESSDNSENGNDVDVLENNEEFEIKSS